MHATLMIEIGWLALLGAIELAAAQWERRTNGHTRKLRNISFAVVNHIAMPPITLFLISALGSRFGTHWAASLPWPLALTAAILALDFAGYWFHRASHEIEFLWRFHQVHHMDEDLDFTTGTRVHLAEAVLHQILLVAVVVALGVPRSCFTAYATISFLIAIFHHSNIAIPRPVERVLRLVLFTPLTHGTHHHDLIDNNQSNYGFILPWWDRMFGTYNKLDLQPEWRVGVSYSGDLKFLRLMFAPFAPTPLWEFEAPAGATNAEKSNPALEKAA
ncbi:fatty acid hydroxylase [Segniliparus rotundus DSM 44985]|uniref:Fatty acid hydroxylase n=1 Tax=Segniliparus rotundus (strain ATCC BAA-972 / CDC 1076 / CIP 108378 / DSM 44985 / JCM 13578) TaxID=640132 RepID=D6ZBE2_SEGRD|nr:sterol desaturase family protein [Segniliparus rotundus]ADG98894.1 fatty acid hydroxylase [Segniliparus rotundus DSM 44985]